MNSGCDTSRQSAQYEILEAMNVEQLCPIERFQLRQFGHVTRMPGYTHGKAAQRSPRWHDYISDFACFCLGVKPADQGCCWPWDIL